MKVIFLDIDGVLNHQNYFVRSQKHILQEFCPRAIENLRHILKATGSKIVISSSWRKLYGGNLRLQKRRIFSHYGLSHHIVGRTPYLANEIRGKEIQMYLDYHPEIDQFVILDDDDDMGELHPFLVETSWESGLCETAKGLAIQLLNG